MSDAGGLRQIRCYIETLAPGAVSSERHWHEKEDEFLFVLKGTATVTTITARVTLAPAMPSAGRMACRTPIMWRTAAPDPLRYLILGSRVLGDNCTYPDSGRRLVNTATRWQVEAADGTVLRAGDLPPHLLNLASDWGQPWDGIPLPRILRADRREWVSEDAYVSQRRPWRSPSIARWSPAISNMA